ncbi:hypothetical protein VC83_05609 [Pseudogymnoascus destructans]|uniref:Cryptic loci regulator 2 N-terminal domain-containing protein n=2 Tax=Pseudogymnoascus destructans TaxID=655981 RepID=L8FS16_PSED2|nr:uncharacterized protein VC83_05609 [Pseudogymnoascus destructans]ELR03770.1 hypothetical protein GMDG_06397 [Pseudogymnoascus destructans 20631-21]OAF57857.1 hypothetical protein VC83_05609 [Pseudogymnoascus destructans]
MARFTTVSVARSDGRSEYLQNGSLVPNEPPRKDETPGPDGSIDFYLKLQENDPTALDWKRKLGGMLVRDIGGPAQAGTNFILAELPKDYVLWQHRRVKAKNGKANADSARQDTYLYGHPNGKGRFRSAQEFYPHLLWLACDQENDSFHNCSCKYCFSDRMAESEAVTKSTQPEALTKPIDGRAEPPKAALAAPLARKAAIKTEPRTSQIPNSKTEEQKLDSNPANDFIYRPGEIVWFSKRTSAWGLSVVLKRDIEDNQHRYLLQPLSHPASHPATVVRDRDSIRPWLAWTVPHPTIARLRELTYDQVPWARVVTGEFGKGDPEVDGSILAAKAINESYSLFDRVDLPTAPGEMHYKGMFLGGEKIWVGEPVRLMGRTKDEIVILVVNQMIERTVDATSAVTIVGDVYKFIEMPMPAEYQDRQNWPINEDLPVRVNADLSFRNQVSADAGGNTWCEWRLLEPMARKGLNDIKGRWYETKLLLPTLRGKPTFDLDVQAGTVSDASLFMNSRGEVLGSRPGIRKKNRLATLGGAVPADTKISRGLDGPPEDNIIPAQAQ